MIEQYIKNYLQEMKVITDMVLAEQTEVIGKMIAILSAVRQQEGRLFIVGVGGGAGTGSHAANDFMKIGGLATINLSDNASLLTALANDEGWESVFVRQLEMHQFTGNDCLLVFSVGGGTANTSANLVAAIDQALALSAPVLGVVGKLTGHAAQQGTAVLVVPEVNEERVTPHTESWQLVIEHLLVNALAQLPAHETASAQQASHIS